MTKAKPKRKYTRKALGNNPFMMNDLSGEFSSLNYNAQAALRMFTSWCYAACLLNAERAASFPKRLYVRSRAGKKSFHSTPVNTVTRKHLEASASPVVRRKVAEWSGNYEQVDDNHPLMALFNHPNKQQTGYAYEVNRWIQWQLFGSAYVLMQPGPYGTPESLWTLPSIGVQTKWDDKDITQGAIEYRVAGVTYPAKTIIHYSMPGNLENPLKGYGKLEAAWSVLQLRANKRDMDLSLSFRAAYPFMVFLLQGANADTISRFETEIGNKVYGPRKAGKVLGINAKEASITQPTPPVFDAGDTQAIIDEIAAVFKVPNVLLTLKDTNLATAKTAKGIWYEGTIGPMHRYDEETDNAFLVPLYDAQDAFVAYDPIGDTTDAEASASALYKAKLMTRNEARVRAGLEPVDGEDTFDTTATTQDNQNATPQTF